MAIRIPFDYQEVEWIESHGTEYLDLGLKTDKTFKIEMGAMFLETSNNEQPLISTWLSSPNYWNLFLGTDERLSFYYAGHLYTSVININEKLDIVLGADANGVFGYSGKRWVTVNGTTVSATTSLLNTNATSVKVLARGDLNGRTKARVWYIRQYNSEGSVVRDCIPCYRKSDGEGGVYCLVNKMFFPNQGTGAFAVGADVNRVDRTFQSGTVGSTNVIEGRHIDDSMGQIVNYTMLYDYGDECTDITGGWSMTYNSGGGSLTKETSHMKLASQNTMYSSKVTFPNSIPLAEKVGFFAVHKGITRYSSSDGFVIGFGLNTSKNDNGSHVGTNYFFSNTTESAKQMAYIAKSETTGYFYISAYNCTDIRFYHVGYVKADDWSTLAFKANITASSIDDILAKSSTLLANESAVNFMCKKCTGDFMVSAVANITFLTALESSPYKNKVYANPHWAKFLAMVA